jgi:hypothetical protein
MPIRRRMSKKRNNFGGKYIKLSCSYKVVADFAQDLPQLEV